MREEVHKNEFAALLADLYDTLGAPFPGPELEEDDASLFEIEVEDTGFTLIHMPEVEPGRFTLFCRFGKLDGNEHAAMRRALELNLVSGFGGGAVLGMNPHSNEMVLVTRMAIEDIDGEALAVAVSLMARQAQQWRKTQFLEEDPLPLEDPQARGGLIP